MPRNSLKLACTLSLAIGGGLVFAQAQPDMPTQPPMEENQLDRPEGAQPDLPTQENQLEGQLDRPDEEIFIAEGAEGREADKQQIERIATFVGEDTIAISKLDLSKIDVKAAEEWFKDLARTIEGDPQRQQAVVKQFTDQFGVAQSWVDNMKKAGAKNVYCAISMPQAGQPVSAVIVPVGEGANVQEIQKLIMPPAAQQRPAAQVKLETAVIRDAVVMAPQDAIQALREPKKTDPASLSKAMESVSGSAIQMAFTPTDRTRQWAQQMTQQAQQALPQDVKAEELRTIPERLEWTAIGIDSPPNQSLKIIASATNEDAAKQISQTLERVLKAARENKDIAANVQNIERITQALTPKVEGERLTVTLEKEQFNQLFKQDLAQALRQARGEQPVRATDIPADKNAQEKQDRNQIQDEQMDDEQVQEDELQEQPQ